jgi:hypothetical protein
MKLHGVWPEVVDEEGATEIVLPPKILHAAGAGAVEEIPPPKIVYAAGALEEIPPLKIVHAAARWHGRWRDVVDMSNPSRANTRIYRVRNATSKPPIVATVRGEAVKPCSDLQLYYDAKDYVPIIVRAKKYLAQ